MIDEVTMHDLWSRLQAFYLRNDVPNKVYLRERLFSFKMNAAKSMDENLDEFKRLTFEINQTKEKLEKESKVTILLNYLPDTYKDVKVAMKHGREYLYKFSYCCHKL